MIGYKKRNQARFLFIGILSVLLTCFLKSECESAVSQTETLLTKADQCRNSLYHSSKKIKYRHNWLKCIKKYEVIYQKYPKSEQAPFAMYRSARMYQGLYNYSGLAADIDKALKIYEQVITDYNDHRLADDAQYKIGEINYRIKKDLTRAYVEFLKVDIKFPSGDMRPRARKMMDKLSVMLGKKANQEEEKADGGTENGLTNIKEIRHWSTPTYTRVVVDLEGPVTYHFNLLKQDKNLNKPRRLYLDLERTRIGSDIESIIPIKDGLLQRARAGQYNQDTVRVVLDINNIEGYKIFPLHDPFRIVVDVRGAEKNGIPKQEDTARAETRPPRRGIRRVETPDKTVSLARQLGLSVKRIVIDPGHGGKDPGCYHKGGIKEKTIVLDLAKKLAGEIEKKLGCEVLLTRTKDIFLPLDERTAFANIKKADLFISLHVNAHKQSNIFGVETYFLNMATDKRAVMLAARENATSEKNISDLQSILNDLILNTKISESNKLAHQVQKGMMNHISKDYHTKKSLGVKQAPFYVLIGAEMPAILIETGFITNPVERKRLQSRDYQGTLVEGIAAGIDQYIKGIDLAFQGG